MQHGLAFYEIAAQVIPVLVLVLLIELPLRKLWPYLPRHLRLIGARLVRLLRCWGVARAAGCPDRTRSRGGLRARVGDDGFLGARHRGGRAGKPVHADAPVG